MAHGFEGLVPSVDMEVNTVGDELVLAAAEDFEGADHFPDLLEANGENSAFDTPAVVVIEGAQDFLVEWVSISWLEILETGSQLLCIELSNRLVVPVAHPNY